jgi:hypothetical protein
MKKAYGKKLDDKLWIPFVWDTVYYLMREQNDGGNGQEDQHVENMETPNCSYTYDNHV